MPPSLPVLPSLQGEGRQKIPDSQLLSMERELQSNSVAPYSTHLVSNNGVIGPLYSPRSGISPDLHFSSVSNHEEHLAGGSFIPQSSNNGISVPLPYPQNSGSFQSQELNAYSKESTGVQWSADTIQEFLDFADNVSVVNGGIVASEDLTKGNEWEWVTNDDNLTPNWNELFPEATATEPGPEVIYPCTQ